MAIPGYMILSRSGKPVLTAENIAKAVKMALEHEIASGANPEPELRLEGEPDEGMAKLLEAKGGSIRIVIVALPATLAEAIADEFNAPLGHCPQLPSRVLENAQ